MAGASMKDIKLRIRSVESTMQITKAMQLVATSKLRRAKERMENSKPYTRISTAAISAAVAYCDDPSVPYGTPRGGKGRCYVLIAGDRGLAGGYNANLFKAFSAHAEGADVCVLPLGRKAIERCHRLGLATLTDDYPRVEGMSVGTCYHLARLLLDSYDAALFCHEYKDWGIEMPAVITATAFVDELIAAGRLIPRKGEGVVTYHDASRLARDLNEHQPARNIIASMGLTLHEMWQNRRLAKCCGSAVVGQYMPELRAKVAQGRWSDVLRTDARVLVAACPQSTEALAAVVPQGCQYQDLFVLLDAHL